MPNPFIEKAILKVRPSILALPLKKLFRIERREAGTVFGPSFWVDPVSFFGAGLIENNVYEPQLSRAIRSLLRPGDTFFDIGANEGYFSVLASAAVKSEGRVFLVEPQKRLEPVIKKNLALNSCGNVRIVSAAFSDRSGTADLNLSPSVRSGNTSFHKRSWFTKKVSVPATTLDEHVSANAVRRIRLVKIDCEGAEFLVLSGAKKTLKERVAEMISVDYHPQIVGEAGIGKIDALLRANGYLLTETAGGPWFYHLPSLRQDLAPLGPLKDIPPF